MTDSVNPARFVAIPTKWLGMLLDAPRHASANAVHVLAVKLDMPNHTLNERNLRQRFNIGERRFREGIAMLEICGILERMQTGRRTYATERIIGLADGAPFVALDRALLAERSTLVAFVAAVNLSPAPQRPEAVARRLGITSPTAIRALVRDARAGGHVACHAGRKGIVHVARRGHQFGGDISTDVIPSKMSPPKMSPHSNQGESSYQGESSKQTAKSTFPTERTHLPIAATPQRARRTDSDFDSDAANPWQVDYLLGWTFEGRTAGVCFDEVDETAVHEIATAYQDDDTLRAMVHDACGGRVHRRLLTTGGMEVVRWLAGGVMAHAHKTASDDEIDQDGDGSPVTPWGAMGVVLQALRDRWGRRDGEWLNSYAALGLRLAGEMYTSGITSRAARPYHAPVTEEELATGDGREALRRIMDVGGAQVLAPELHTAADSLCMFLETEAINAGRSRVTALLRVVDAVASAVANGWQIGGVSRAQASDWSVFAGVVRQHNKQERAQC